MALTRTITPILPIVAEIRPCFEEASLNIKKGSPVADLDRNGNIAELGADDADLLGFMMHDSKNNAAAATAQSLVALALAASLFSGNIEDNVTPGHALVNSDNLAEMGLSKDGTSAVWHIDENEKDGLDSRVRVIQLLDPIGSIRGRAMFTPTHDAIEFNDT